MFLTAEYVWWILGACIAGPILILLVVATVIALVKRIKLARKYPNVKAQDVSVSLEYVEAFGENNIVDVSMEMSRVTVTVKDVDTVNPEKLKELGASGVLLVGSMVKCSFKENVEAIYNTLKGSINHE